MLADELHIAVTNIVDILDGSRILPALSQYRSAAINDRDKASRELSRAANHIIQRMDMVSRPERLVARAMHIEALGTADYWERLLGDSIDPHERQAEIVRLGSRLMFATSQLPSLVKVLMNLNGRLATVPHHVRLFRPGNNPEALAAASVAALANEKQSTAAALPGVARASVNGHGVNGAADTALSGAHAAAPGGRAAGTGNAAEPLRAGESRIRVRLEDAGERATDPDRIARTIDGIDMVYTASASLARRPAIDLRLEELGRGPGTSRIIEFVGQTEAVKAMQAVLESIPEALADLDPDEEDIDLEGIIQSLPIFDDLKVLARSGRLPENDFRDINEAMYQGALLTLESGVILESVEHAHVSFDQTVPPILNRRATGTNGAAHPPTVNGAAHSAAVNGAAHPGAVNGARPPMPGSQGLVDDDPATRLQQNQAVDELLRAIGNGSR